MTELHPHLVDSIEMSSTISHVKPDGTKILSLAASDTSGVMKKLAISRRKVQENDVEVAIHYCGICHSDLHQIRGEWAIPCRFPMVPGHEMAGIVTAVGSRVTKFKPGDRAGVGVMVDSCKKCVECKRGQEQYCIEGMTASYNTLARPEHWVKDQEDQEVYGGYAQTVVCRESFVIKIPDSLDLDVAAPLLCAGITTYSPLVAFGARAAGKKWKVGIMGFGGLGHMGAKFSKAMGNKCFVISRNSNKKKLADDLGVGFLCSSDPKAMRNASRTFDMILCTVSANCDFMSFFDLLNTDGQFVLVGLPPNPVEISAFSIIGKRLRFAGSLIGGIKETEEMMEFCAKNQIWAEIKVIGASEVNHAMKSLETSSADAPRFVINIKDTLKEGDWEVEDDAGIDPSTWKVRGMIIPLKAKFVSWKSYISPSALGFIVTVASIAGLGALAWKRFLK